MNDTHQEDEVLAGPLIFTVPAYGFVMALYLDCLAWSNARPFLGKTLPEDDQPIEPARIKLQDEDRCSAK
jgi:hypothetical protein